MLTKVTIQRALAIDPNNKYALNNKGNALSYQGDNTQAIQYFDKALAIDPNYKNALVDEGAALSNQRDYTQAIQYFDKALAIDPNFKPALAWKQTILYRMGNESPAADGYFHATTHHHRQ